jgi:hypothetical protein
VLLIAAPSYLGSVSISQVSYRLGQLARSGHLRLFHKHRNDRNIPLQSRLDFNTHIIAKIFDPPPSLIVGQLKPLIANHDQEHIALSDRIPDVLPKIDPERDIIEIKKNRVCAEAGLESVS